MASPVDVAHPLRGAGLPVVRTGDDHHHLVCRSCGGTVEVLGPAVESWADRIAAEQGYTDVSHTLEIFGTCPRCAAPPHAS
jgi:Fur family ferric uptake transcriptional regulator